MPPLLIRIGHLQPVETADCVDHGKAQPRRTLLLRSLIEPVEDTPGVERTARTAVADREATRSDAHRHLAALVAVNECVFSRLATTLPASGSIRT